MLVVSNSIDGRLVNVLEWEFMEFKFVDHNIHHVYVTFLDTQARLKIRQPDIVCRANSWMITQSCGAIFNLRKEKRSSLYNENTGSLSILLGMCGT